VTSLQDELNPNDNSLSLREAILLSNGSPGANTIVFQPGLTGNLLLNLPVADGGGVLDITNPVTIEGPAAFELNIQQTIGGQSVFNLASAAGVANPSAFNVTISGVTISGSSGAPGIQNTGENVTLLNDEITGNSATTGAGITSDTSKTGNLLVQNSTVAQNNATGTGGGLSLNGPASIVNSTISSNTAGTNGGGIDIGAMGNVIIRNSTIAFNSATTGFNGGGGMRIATGSTVTLQSDLVAQNTGGDINGAPVGSSSNNFIGSPVGLSGLQNGVNGNQLGTQQDPRLGPLTFNAGGTTRTHALLQGSPAIGNGSNPAGLTTDQNGQPRSVNGITDIGAVAFQGTNNNNNGGSSSSSSGSSTTTQAPNVAILQQIVFFALSQPAGTIQILGLVDFQNDGTQDIVLSIGKGRNQVIVILDGADGSVLFMLPVASRG
jgi:hypothetical protein